MKRAALLIINAAICGALSGCFTGIESTPRITPSDVSHAGVRTTSEQAFAATLIPEAPRAWMPGKQWQVADTRIAMIFTASSGSCDSLVGRTITSASERRVPSVTGVDAIELAFTGPDGQSLYYRPDLPADDWDDRASLAIPFAIELSPVAKADSLMRGNTYYITTPLWRDATGSPAMGLRHIAVRVDSVTPGTERYPLKVAFTPVSEPDAKSKFILMTYGTSASATRNFDRLFSFTDPRRSYPRITDATWQKIIRSQVEAGMTRDECRLALGAPDHIDRGATPGAQLERWTYDNGVYLIFEDGILERWRK